MKANDLLSAKPSRRTEMVMDGFVHVAFQLNKISKEINILTRWLEKMPSLLSEGSAKFPEDEDYEELIKSYADAGDELTKSIVANAQQIDELTKALNFYKKYGNDTIVQP